MDDFLEQGKVSGLPRMHSATQGCLCVGVGVGVGVCGCVCFVLCFLLFLFFFFCLFGYLLGLLSRDVPLYFDTPVYTSIL